MLEKRVWWRINRAQQAEVQQTKQAPSGGEVAYDCASCGCVSKLVRQGTLSLEVTVVRAGQLGLWEHGIGRGRGSLGERLKTEVQERGRRESRDEEYLAVGVGRKVDSAASKLPVESPAAQSPTAFRIRLTFPES